MRRLTVLLFILLLLPSTAPPAASHQTGRWPSSIAIPVDFAPEGVAVGRRHAFFVGSLVDGDVYRGDLRTGAGALLVDNHADEGRMAVGMEVDRRRHRLFVAGGITGQGYVYDVRDGTMLAELDLGTPGEAFVNDVTVTRRAAYFTDTLQAKIYKVPFRRWGGFRTTRTIEVSGPAATLPPPGMNGIDATPDGRLLVNHTSLGILAVVDPTTGISTEIPLTGPSLEVGTLDGLLLSGRTAWVVQNLDNSVAEVRLAPDLSSGTVTRVLTSDLFRVPATVARHGCRLVLVNGRFDLGLPPPFGPGAPVGTDYDVVQLKP